MFHHNITRRYKLPNSVVSDMCCDVAPNRPLFRDHPDRAKWEQQHFKDRWPTVAALGARGFLVPLISSITI